MYILFFGGFIFFLDCVDFILENKKKKNKLKTHKNLILRYIQACNKRNWFIRISHYLCIVGIVLSAFAQLISLFPLTNVTVILLEVITSFLIGLLTYLCAYQIARALFLQHMEANNIIIQAIFFLAFLYVVLTLVGIEVYIVIEYLKSKFAI